jgi:hypothetical protein
VTSDGHQMRIGHYEELYLCQKKLKISQVRHCTYKRNTGRMHVTFVAVKKQKVLHILSMSVALVTQHAKRMRLTILSSVTCLAVAYFSILPHKWHAFRGVGGRRIQRDIVINVHTSSCKVLLVRF